MATHMLVPTRYHRAVGPALRGVSRTTGLQSDIDRLFADVWRGFGRAPAADTANAPDFTPRVDVRETDDEIRFVAELPGLEEKDFEVVYEGDVLTLKGERRTETEDDSDGVYHREISHGSFARSFRLPFEADPETVTAAYAKGVLTITVPKPAEAQPQVRTIPIQTA